MTLGRKTVSLDELERLRDFLDDTQDYIMERASTRISKVMEIVERMLEADEPQGSPLLLLNEVSEITRLSTMMIRRLIRTGKFPRPVQLTENQIAWRKDEVDAWIANLPRPPSTKITGEFAGAPGETLDKEDRDDKN